MIIGEKSGVNFLDIDSSFPLYVICNRGNFHFWPCRVITEENLGKSYGEYCSRKEEKTEKVGKKDKEQKETQLMTKKQMKNRRDNLYKSKVFKQQVFNEIIILTVLGKRNLFNCVNYFDKYMEITLTSEEITSQTEKEIVFNDKAE